MFIENYDTQPVKIQEILDLKTDPMQMDLIHFETVAKQYIFFAVFEGAFFSNVTIVNVRI